MSSTVETAELRFRLAFNRLKANKPEVLPRGTPVSQNNVAKEAGTDATALKKKRYPTLIRDIQAFVEIQNQERERKRQNIAEKRRARNDLTEMVKDLKSQRDDAQSQLISAKRRVLELLEENRRLRARLDESLPPPTPLRRRQSGLAS
ncbi:hypothetical protein [Burkholderia ubonensis]|uniref:hypothetical protein n=1 Tax=Burkholderia ubonensis TaxID=101571 RepID=UPI0008FDFA72|nr:hypothetical protein [Burkholderia ubonensis]